MTAPATGSVGWLDPDVEDAPRVRDFYVVVADLDASVASAGDLGGEVIAGPKAMGNDRYAVLRDPAGAPFALWQKGT